MKINRITFLFLLLLTIMSLLRVIQAQTVIDITSPMSPPVWALMERLLLEEKSQHIKDFYFHLFDENGYLLHQPRWGILDGPDDLFDIFGDWTLLYSLGGREFVLELYRKGNNGGIRQYSEYKTVDTEIAKGGAYYQEFICMSDWHHTGEGMRGFHLEALTDPADYVYQQRARRFASFYTGENPDVPNYDPVNKVIRSIWTGSRGPLLRRAKPIDWTGDRVEGKYHLLHGPNGGQAKQEMSEAVFENEMLAHCYEYLHSVGDHPLNLISTNLALNAYGLSHEQKYLEWVVEYLDAWINRINNNGGNIPTNVGLDGSIGGETENKWYGGTYGWDFAPWSPEHNRVEYRNMFTKGMWPGFSNGLLLTGNQKYVDVLRRQIDNIYAQKKVVKGKTVYPHNYGEKSKKSEPPIFVWKDGDLYWTERELTKPQWYNFTSDAYLPWCMDIYMMSMEPQDYERVILDEYIQYLAGNNPDYPVIALQQGIEEVRRDNHNLRNDPTTPETRLADWPMRFNNYEATLALNRLMCGAYLHGMIYTQHARFRFFDPERYRSGIPLDVAALVTKMSKENTTVILVNLNQTRDHTVIVQTGAYGEHQCTSVEVKGKSYPVNYRLFTVRLAPGAGAELVVYADRYVNRPTLALPWHGNTVPLP
jgi:hypothetical protein